MVRRVGRDKAASRIAECENAYSGLVLRLNGCIEEQQVEQGRQGQKE